MAVILQHIMRRLAFILSILLLGLAPMRAAQVRLSGTVTDSLTGEAIQFATITVKPGSHATLTDASGQFSLSLPAGNYQLTASFVGYASRTRNVRLTASTSIHITMAENAKVLHEVVVTAREGSGLTSTSRIGRDAMSHLQPTSFTDLLELLPGNMSQTPNMGSANAISLRETGTMGATGTATRNDDYAISSLGTLFMVDGAPINGDANLQQVPTTTTDASAPEYKRDMTNRGVDMRTISTDNIESVEIVRGIPSAEYGNLTSGMVKINRIKRATPLTARFKADEYSHLFSIGKGFNLGHSSHVLNVDGSYLDSKVDPRNNLENYKRITLSARLNLNWQSSLLSTHWVTGVDYTGSFDNAKTDPDLSYNKVNKYKSNYNRINYTSDLTLRPQRLRWLSEVNLNASLSYEHDRLHREKQVAPQRASVAPTTTEPGVHDGQYLLSEYVAHFISDGQPVNLFVKLKLGGEFDIASVTNHYKLGGDFTLSKNLGDGQVYDLTKPLSASWTTRPRAYNDIPALHVLSWWAEDNVTIPLGKSKLQLQAGLRTQQLPGLSKKYRMSGKVYLDPRLNAKLDLPNWGRLVSYVAGGYGVTTKMPTVSYLYPQAHYSDFIQLNYYDVNSPTTLSRISLMTYIDDVTPYQLKPAVNHKWEVRLGLQLGHNKLTVTYFNEKMRSGYRYSAVYKPYTYTRYDATAINATGLTAPPSLADLPSEQVNELSGYRVAANGSRLDKQGIEFVLNTARWRPLATALTVTGAWFRSTYSNSQMLYDPVTDVVNNRPVSDSYVGYYNYNDGRVNQQFNTNFMFDTQITRWGLVFSTSVQCMWFTSTRKMRMNGVPVSYLDVADGKLHPYTTEMQTDPVLQFLVQTYSDASFRKQTIPIATYVNLKATKTVGKHLKIAVFANRLLDYLPDYKSNGLTVRRITDPYFGMELNFSL